MIELKLSSGNKDSNKSKDNTSTLNLTGKLTVEHAEEIKEALKKALKNSNQLEIHLMDPEQIDLTCLQLLYSAHKSYSKENKKLLFIGDPPERFKQAVIDAGLEYHEGRDIKTDMHLNWTGIKNG